MGALLLALVVGSILSCSPLPDPPASDRDAGDETTPPIVDTNDTSNSSATSGAASPGKDGGPGKEGGGIPRLPGLVQTNAFGAQPDQDSHWWIAWPRLAALLVQATLGARLESEQYLDELPSDVRTRVEHLTPWTLPEEAGSWVDVVFSPSTPLGLGLRQDKIVQADELVITAPGATTGDGAGDAEAAESRLYVKTSDGWLMYTTEVAREDIERYNAVVLERNRGE